MYVLGALGAEQSFRYSAVEIYSEIPRIPTIVHIPQRSSELYMYTYIYRRRERGMDGGVSVFIAVQRKCIDGVAITLQIKIQRTRAKWGALQVFPMNHCPFIVSLIVKWRIKGSGFLFTKAFNLVTTIIYGFEHHQLM